MGLIKYMNKKNKDLKLAMICVIAFILMCVVIHLVITYMDPL